MVSTTNLNMTFITEHTADLYSTIAVFPSAQCPDVEARLREAYEKLPQIQIEIAGVVLMFDIVKFL